MSGNWQDRMLATQQEILATQQEMLGFHRDTLAALNRLLDLQLEVLDLLRGLASPAPPSPEPEPPTPEPEPEPEPEPPPHPEPEPEPEPPPPGPEPEPPEPPPTEPEPEPPAPPHGVNPHAPPPPLRPGAWPGTSGRILLVGRDYATVRDAMRAAQDGDTIHIPPGQPRESFEVSKNVLIDARNVAWDFTDVPSSQLFQRKGGIVGWATAWVVRGINIRGAGIRETSAGLVSGIRVGNSSEWVELEDCVLVGNQNGVGAESGNWMLTLRRCELRANGLGDGLSHNLYVNRGHTLILEEGFSVEPNRAHAIKSRAWHTVVRDYLAEADLGTCLDIPDGGLLMVIASTLHKRTSTNRRFLSYCVESTSSGALDTSTLGGGSIMQLDVERPFVQVGAGVVTFDNTVRWEGNRPNQQGNGKAVGLPS